MRWYESKTYGLFEVASNLFLLHLLWLAFCLPVITAFPATAAMFATFRSWDRGEQGIVGPFWSSFRTYLRQALWLGVLWVGFGGILVADFAIGLRVGQPLGTALFLLTMPFVLPYLFAFVWVFPVMVSNRQRWYLVLWTSLLLSVAHLRTTLLCLSGLAVLLVLVIGIPALLFIGAGSAAAYFVHRVCNRAISRAVASEKRPHVTS